MDEALRRLEQQALADPGDGALRERLRAHLRRIADLSDRERWGAAEPEAQDVVLGAVARLLGPRFVAAGAALYEAGGVRHRIGAVRHAPTEAVLHVIPGGRFVMGSTYGPLNEATTPLREVALRPFLLGRFPLLQGEWDRIGGEDERTWRGSALPIEGVSWHEARAWLARAGDGLRLPSEAEWEYACRAGTTTEFFWGQEMDPRYCWFGDTHTWRSHAPAEHAAYANAFGLVDCSGNVAEWCEDDFVRGYAGAPGDGTPRRAARRWGEPDKVVRGGDGFNSATTCRSGARSSSRPKDRGAGIGLRLARDLPL